MENDCICALSTPTGRGALGLIRVSGKGCVETVEQIFIRKNGQTMNVNFGIFPDLGERIKSKPERAERHANRALETIQNFINTQAI